MEAVVEISLREINLNKIAGVDESGRGPLMGPVVVACVILPVNHKIEGLNDSKKLSAKKRNHLSKLIHERALDIQIAFGFNGLVDQINIYQATKKCIQEVVNNLKIKPDIVVIDGIFTAFMDESALKYPYQTLPKGDTLSENIASASIVAKEARDNWVVETAHSLYPQYDFNRHKGYGTKRHIEMLKKYGPCPLHRMSFSVNGIYIRDMIK